MTASLPLIAMLCIPLDTPSDAVDEIELNTLYSSEAEVVFVQLIGWDWHYDEPQRRVVFWRLVKSPTFAPCKRGCRYELIWTDGETLRRVTAKRFTETHTQHDPEMRNRRVWPTDKRRGLTTRRTKASE